MSTYRGQKACHLCKNATMSEMRQRQKEGAEKALIFLGTLASGQKVYDRETSHIHDSPRMMELLTQAISQTHLSNQTFVRVRANFDNPIGENMCVPTSPGDTIKFGQREKRAGLTRFVMNRNPEPTSTLNVMFLKNPKDPTSYILITAFMGIPGEREPWDPYSDNRASEFWSTHALIWDGKGIVQGTETDTDPSQYWTKLPIPDGAPAQMPPPEEIQITISPAQ